MSLCPLHHSPNDLILLSNASALGLEGTWTHSPPLVAMHLLNRSCVSVGFFLKLHATFPNSGIRARSMRRWYARVEHKELWAIILILLTTKRLTLIRRYCWMKWPGQTLHDRVHETGSIDVFLHIGCWRVSISPTLVGSSFDYGRSLLKVKTGNLTKHRCAFDA